MGRVKKATARGWDTTNKEREERTKAQKGEEKEITPEEHDERVKKLKALGLI